ncbi:MAG: secretin N-terminal domain-containing protein [Rhodocyclaceae bacterium]|nr:secretin N-terminal domain-containing protein [Rhodocyclaceae bacterium]
MKLRPFCLALLLAACAANPPLEKSREDFTAGDPLVALARLEKSVREHPGNVELRSYYIRQRDLLVSEGLAAAERARLAGRWEEAAQRYADAGRIDPQNPRVRAGLEDVAGERRREARLAEARAALQRGDSAQAERLARAVVAEAPAHPGARAILRELDEGAAKAGAAAASGLQGPLAKPVTLEFREAPLRVVFEALSRAAGLNFVFDRDVRAESRVTLFVRNSTVDEVLKLLTATQQIERKVLNANSVLIYPATAAKHREYTELVTRSFYLANADAKQAMALVKSVVKSKDVFIDEKLNLLIVKDTPDAVRLAERVIAALDVAEPEVMLEVEVLEVSRNKLLNLGLEFPDQVGYGLLQDPLTTAVTTATSTTTATTPGGTLAAGVVNLRNTGALVPYVSNPALVLRLRAEDGDSSLLANPRIRVKNREKAKIHIGDKLPVFTTTATANVGVSASVNYLDVGLKLDVEPSVTLDDEVAIKVALEVSSIVKEVTGPSNSLAYQVGTRNASTVLRLRNGETQVLAGLINDEDRSSASRLPGLGHLPLVGRLFTAQKDSSAKTEIVLLITPRIVRNVVAPALARAEQPAGTEASVGAQPLLLRPTAPNSLGLRGDGRPAGGALPAPLAVVEPAVEAPVPVATLSAPPGVRRGETFTAVIQLEGLGVSDAGELTVDYDPARFEPVSGEAAQPGQLVLPLAVGGGTVSAQLNLKVKGDASGSGGLAVSGLVLRQAGQERRLPVVAAATIQILAE